MDIEIKKPKMENATFNFTQEGNYQGTTQEIEELEISFESSLGLDNDGDGYYVIKTTGWSIENANELHELFERIKKIMH